MIIRSLVSSLIVLSTILAQIPPSPADIEKELQSAKDEFDQAKKLFNPWYSGPLLTGSGNTFPPGIIGIQPYLNVIDNYALFKESGHSKNIDDILVINPLISILTGINSHVEINLNFGWTYQQQNGVSGNGFNDTGLRLGIGLLEETLNLPAIKFNLEEIFPTGKYDNLSPTGNGLDATGSGSYQTLIGIATSKVVLFTTEHPMSFRGSFSFIFPSKVSVKGFNNYGGGFETDGIVTPGKSLTAAFAFEYSINQSWVFANDFVYTYRDKHSFSGNQGTDKDKNPSFVGSPLSDQLSIAPAIEYDPSPNLNFIAGGWLSIWGRNSLQFAGAIISVYLQF